MENFNFLTSLNVPEPEKKVRQKQDELYPLEGDIRIYKNGNVVYSDDFEAKVKLAKDSYKWLDIVFSSEWWQYAKMKDADPTIKDMCFIIINETNKPNLGDIRGPGKRVYITDQFLEKASELWSIDWEARGFVDFKIIYTPGLYVKFAQIPKVTNSGEHKGEEKNVKREDITLLPFVPILETETVVVKNDPAVVEDTMHDNDDNIKDTMDDDDDDIRNEKKKKK